MNMHIFYEYIWKSVYTVAPFVLLSAVSFTLPISILPIYTDKQHIEQSNKYANGRT